MDRNPQAEQMADESMLRTLAAQASAIWPAEQALFARYGLPAVAKIADVGCGSGEITSRLAALYAQAEIVGLDILEGPLAHARAHHGHLTPRVRFEHGDAFALEFGDNTFDLVVCRHVTQAVPEPEKVLAELYRICKPGGWLHVLSEDYGMLHFPAAARELDPLWHQAVGELSRVTHTDERIGRKTFGLMNRLGVTALSVDYVVVDTQRVPRETFADIIRAWRDGYWESLEKDGGLPSGQARALFDASIAHILDPNEYAVWHVPVVSGRKP